MTSTGHLILTDTAFRNGAWPNDFLLTPLQQDAALTQPPEARSVWVCTALRQWPDLVMQLRDWGKQVAVLSLAPSLEQARTAFTLGARAYTEATAPANDLRRIATSLEANGLWLPEQLMLALLQQLPGMIKQPVSKADKTLFEGLTPRERDVCAEVTAGKSNKVVARNLGITERTVKEHLSNIFNKLNVKDRMQLALMFHQSEQADSNRAT